MGKEIVFDYSKTAGFISEEEMKNMKSIVMGAKDVLTAKSGAGNDYLGWIDLPVDYDKEEFARIKKAAEKIQGDSDVLLVIGIGGSYLGARAAIEFLSHSFYNVLPKGKRKTPEIYFVGNSISSKYIADLKKVLAGKDFSINIISKIENSEGVNHIDDIIYVSDGIMVARGDMGVEIPAEQVPFIQKTIIRKCNEACKPVITATQMLESMITNPRPTRAEITDVANAIYDGTSAIMLSGETAAGAFPVEVVRTMDLIARTTEDDIDYKGMHSASRTKKNADIANAIAHATVTTAHDLDAAAILTVTMSGVTAREISKYRPCCPIISCTVSERVRRQMNLSWGVYPMLVDEVSNTDSLFDASIHAALRSDLVNKGDIVVITAGAPVGVSNTTNMMKVERI